MERPGAAPVTMCEFSSLGLLKQLGVGRLRGQRKGAESNSWTMHLVTTQRLYACNNTVSIGLSVNALRRRTR